jgi:hypothetical protein
MEERDIERGQLSADADDSQTNEVYDSVPGVDEGNVRVYEQPEEKNRRPILWFVIVVVVLVILFVLAFAPQVVNFL